MVCEQLKVQSQNDTAKLAEAKQLVYLKVCVCVCVCACVCVCVCLAVSCEYYCFSCIRASY